MKDINLFIYVLRDNNFYNIYLGGTIMKENKTCDCAVCERIELTKQGKNKYFVRELETGYVVIGDHQRFKGYSLFLCKEHATEIHFLEKDFRKKFTISLQILIYNINKQLKML